MKLIPNNKIISKQGTTKDLPSGHNLTLVGAVVFAG